MALKVLLISQVFKSEVVGPARFARLLHQSQTLDVDILTEEVVESDSVFSIGCVDLSFWKKKLGQFYKIPAYHDRLGELEGDYDFLLFNTSIQAYKLKTSIPYAIMINDEKMLKSTFQLKFDYLRRLILKKTERNAAINAETIIANSNYLKNKIALGYDKDPNSIEVLYKGISMHNKVSDYQQRDLTSKANINILFVKNDYHIGGLSFLIEALTKLTGYNFQLTIAGTHDNVKRELIIAENIEYNVLGYKSNQEIIDLMYQADIFSVPAYYEPLGVAVMEALAVGVPVVTTGVGGLPEVHNNGAYVWQCLPQNSNSIAEQISWCISNPKERKQKSEEGKAFIHKKFNFSNIEKNLISIIEKSIASYQANC